MSQKTLILVIGCHRSGTSAVAGCLSKLGVDLGKNLLGPAFDNPKGFFENREVLDFHEWLLSECGATWDAPGRIADMSMDLRAAAITNAAAILAKFDGWDVFAIKDPRASLFVGIWRCACELAGFRLCVLEVQRDFDAVVSSLCDRELWPRSRAVELVEFYKNALKRTSRANGEIWEVIKFPQDLEFISTWRRIFERIDSDLAWDVSLPAVTEFLDSRLVHHGNGKSPPLWSVIIPSRDPKKLMDCIGSLVNVHPEIRSDQIVIVSDGLPRSMRWGLRGIKWVKGKKPFNFSRAINMGAAAVDPLSDLVILGDDVRLTIPRTFDRLACSATPLVSVIAPDVLGVCGQPAQRATSRDQTADWVAFICAYIPRTMWNKVGPLDERFIGYGYDDVDWCRRAKEFGNPLIRHDVRVIHKKDSSYRGEPDWLERYAENRKIYEDKWRPS